MNESSAPVERSSPKDGDVVVTREAEPRVHFTVRQLPGIVQFSAGGRDGAMQVARSFGQRYGVNVWYSERGAYRLLEVYRPRTSSGAALT